MKYLNSILWSEGIQRFIKVEGFWGSCKQFSNIRRTRSEIGKWEKWEKKRKRTLHKPRVSPWSAFLPLLVEVVLATLGNVEASGEGRHSLREEQRARLSGCRRHLQHHQAAVDRGHRERWGWWVDGEWWRGRLKTFSGVHSGVGMGCDYGFGSIRPAVGSAPFQKYVHILVVFSDSLITSVLYLTGQPKLFRRDMWALCFNLSQFSMFHFF